MANDEYDKFDFDGDGKISADDLAKSERLLDLENKDKKADQQRSMAWIAMISMVVFTIAMFTPLLPVERVAALSDLLGLFYIAQAGVVAAFFGANAYMSNNKK